MNHPLPKKELERLAAVAGMFGSDHAGERAAAAALADKIVRGAGLRWPDVLVPAALPAPIDNSIEAQIAEILAHLSLLNSWERKFVRSLDGRLHFKPKQHAVVASILRKIDTYRAARRRA